MAARPRVAETGVYITMGGSQTEMVFLRWEQTVGNTFTQLKTNQNLQLIWPTTRSCYLLMLRKALVSQIFQYLRLNSHTLQ